MIIDFIKAKKERDEKRARKLMPTKAKIKEALSKFGSFGGKESLDRIKKLFKRDENDDTKTD